MSARTEITILASFLNLNYFLTGGRFLCITYFVGDGLLLCSAHVAHCGGTLFDVSTTVKTARCQNCHVGATRRRNVNFKVGTSDSFVVVSFPRWCTSHAETSRTSDDNHTRPSPPRCVAPWVLFVLFRRRPTMHAACSQTESSPARYRAEQTCRRGGSIILLFQGPRCPRGRGRRAQGGCLLRCTSCVC